MFNRRELKENAKEHLRKTYGMGVLVTLLFGLIGGSAVAIEINTSIASIISMITSSFMTMVQFRAIEGYTTESMVDYEYLYDYFYQEFVRFLNENGTFFLTIFAMLFVIFFLFNLFVKYPLYVGFMRWYLENRQYNSEIGTIGTVFSSGYLNIIKVMFCKDLFISLWSCLFIIPGIIKSYQYRMVPFLLAENPHMGVREATRRSRELMKGNKFETFILDLSFIGWGLLSGMFCTLLTLLYVAPYVLYTEAELYVKLCQKDNYTKPGIMEEDVYSYSGENTY